MGLRGFTFDDPSKVLELGNHVEVKNDESNGVQTYHGKGGTPEKIRV